MTPGHIPYTTQQCESNYVIQPEKLIFQPNETILVTVHGKTSNDLFKGVLLIAYDTNNIITGTWSTTDSNVQTACGDQNITIASIPVVTTTLLSTTDVSVNITWTYADGTTSIKMVTNNLNLQQWVALGLSVDEMMYLSDGTIGMKRMINAGGYTYPTEVTSDMNPGGTFTIIQTKLENNIVTCAFTLSAFTSTKQQRNKRQLSISPLSQTSQYHPLIAIGPLDSSNSMQKHIAKQPQSILVSLNSAEQITYNLDSSDNSTKLVKAHGCLMIFAWILLVSTGILIARYFKKTFANKKLFSEDVWFFLHRAIMTCAATLTLIGFLFILVFKKGEWVQKSTSTSKEFAHSVIGIIIVACSFIQPFIALFRCHPDNRYRFIYNYLHGFIGFLSFTLSIVAIFLAVYFSYFTFIPNTLGWGILVGWSCWIVTIFILFECSEYYLRLQNNNESRKSEMYRMDSATTDDDTSLEPINSWINKIKLLLLGLHILVALTFVLTLVIKIAQMQI
ncbi:unnamed protein product [Didymodactylos carnosus]|uniref:Ferric-chelate reductase 1 n=1 Tax=Didymodactylos carnosus TaxID=1234261 RepID=A0A815K2T6_9BILA|nr:unnamed protein product [Didymodactylos carnosus]CAF1385677.1 unnamed protein product [Didymodactylos carnosus]CAF4037891.1 unnamed protein product [Didymodactylos carnosus]CAF4280618.1 unnamed protein product [Didymodactylos carnosus]